MREIETTFDDASSRTARGLQVAVAAAVLIAGAVFAAGVLVGRNGKAGAALPDEDPLARLDRALAEEEPAPPAAETPLTFHRVLVEPDAPVLSPSELSALGTTRVTAAGSPAAPPTASGSATPSAASERVGHMGRSGEHELPTARPEPASGTTTPTAAAPEGSDGPYTLQIASFQDEQEARRISASLRGQGFRTFLAAADVPGRGMWFRVRIGPFHTQGEVDRARRDYEERTRQPAIVVKREDPRERSGNGHSRH